MMKKLTIVLLPALAAIFVGCGPGGSEMTKDEMDRLKNPTKVIPPEAAKAMAKGMSEGMAASRERNRAAGVDQSGVPLDKTKWNNTSPPAGK